MLASTFVQMTLPQGGWQKLAFVRKRGKRAMTACNFCLSGSGPAGVGSALRGWPILAIWSARYSSASRNVLGTLAALLLPVAALVVHRIAGIRRSTTYFKGASRD